MRNDEAARPGKVKRPLAEKPDKIERRGFSPRKAVYNMARTKELIKAATISRVSDKSGKFLGFGVKSNHSDKYYQIRCVKGLKGVTYTCDCEARQWGKECSHIKAVRELVAARRQNELDGAAAVAPIVLGQPFASELHVHLDDEFSGQPEPDAFDRVYAALVLGTVNHLADIMQRSGLVERELVTNALEVLRANGRIAVKKLDSGVFWIDAPDQAYRTAYYGDFAA